LVVAVGQGKSHPFAYAAVWNLVGWWLGSGFDIGADQIDFTIPYKFRSSLQQSLEFWLWEANLSDRRQSL
jgi:hypothetical protein